MGEVASAPDTGGRVLVVDDEVAVRMLLRALLERDGHEVTEAGSVAEARERLAGVSVDLVLLDLNLPGGQSGSTLLEELRAAPGTRLLPVVMITGTGTRDHKLAALRAGVTDFLAKPFEAEELRARVRALVRLKRFSDELEDAERVIIALARTIDARDPYTRGHSERVSHYAALLAERIGLSAADVAAARRGALFHDIGKIAIRDSVLLKPGRLTPAEFDEIKRHPMAGREIVEHLRTLAYALPIVTHHHERWDGSGYPDGLSGESIPLLARVTSVADVFDALTTERPYRGASSTEEALTIIDDEARRGWWDRRLLEEFRRLVTEST